MWKTSLRSQSSCGSAREIEILRSRLLASTANIAGSHLCPFVDAFPTRTAGTRSFAAFSLDQAVNCYRLYAPATRSTRAANRRAGSKPA